MSQNIEEFRLLEKVKLSYLKHRGNVIEITKETNLPIEYIQKLVAKFKKRESKDIATLISHNLMQYIMLGYDSRVSHLMTMLRALEGRDQNRISLCCEAPVIRVEETIEYGYEDYECLVCHLMCGTKIIDKEGILDLKIEMIEQLREEDKALVDFAEKMGYTNKPAVEPPISVKNNILVIGEGQDRKIVEDYSNLPAMDRQKIIDNIDKQLREREAKKNEQPLP